MTVTELRDCLIALHWSADDLAEEAQVRDTTVRRWRLGAELIPEPIAVALFTLVAFHDAHPLVPKEAPS